MVDALLAAAEGETLGAATINEIAAALNVTRTAIYDWAHKHKDFADAIARARKLADAAVEAALRKKAIGYTTELIEQKLSKDGEVFDLKKELHVPSDTAAASYWLKNRDPERWSDKTKVEISGDFAEQVEAFLNRKDA
jgi:AcrR family transcriptional regulator